jgi:hypothetical protein
MSGSDRFDLTATDPSSAAKKRHVPVAEVAIRHVARLNAIFSNVRSRGYGIRRMS